MKILHIVATTALALGLSQLAYANHHEGADGKKCEYKKHGMMDNDTNKDGAISKDEFMSGHQARADKKFAMMDANKDGKIDQAERDAMKAKWKEHHKSGEMEHGADHK
jgi:Ca2+-binding EF-hand superfamily protein